MEKPAVTRYEIDPLLKKRWSPRSFKPVSLTEEEIGSLMEAARWTASASNLQPWRFIVARRDDEHFERMLAPLADGNTMWARDAGALILSVAQTHKEDGSEIGYAAHDLGQANAMITLQAESLGLRTHQMAGFSKDKAREEFGIPEGFVPMTYIAIGHQGEPEKLADFLEEREKAPRSRKTLEEIVLRGNFVK